jgi:hypothetical protein
MRETGDVRGSVEMRDEYLPSTSIAMPSLWIASKGLKARTMKEDHSVEF